MIRAFRHSVRSTRLWALAWMALFALVVNPLSATSHSMASTGGHMHAVASVHLPGGHCHTIPAAQTKACCGIGVACCGSQLGNCTCPMTCGVALLPSPASLAALAAGIDFAIAASVSAPSIHAGPPLRPPAA